MTQYNGYMPYGMNYSTNPYYQTQQQQNYQPQQYQQYNNMYTQPQQTTYLPLTYVNGIEGAKSFILGANGKVFLKDSDSNILFEKTADQQGKYSLYAYELNPIKVEDIGKEKPVQTTSVDYITKDDLKDFLTKNDFKAFAEHFSNELNKLSSLVQNNARTPKNNAYEQNGGKR